MIIFFFFFGFGNVLRVRTSRLCLADRNIGFAAAGRGRFFLGCVSNLSTLSDVSRNLRKLAANERNFRLAKSNFVSCFETGMYFNPVG